MEINTIFLVKNWKKFIKDCYKRQNELKDNNNMEDNIVLAYNEKIDNEILFVNTVSKSRMDSSFKLFLSQAT